MTYDIIGLGSTIAVASIVIGIIIAVVSFLGCFGAANEKGMLLKSYFALLILLVILELGVGFAAYGKRDTVESLLATTWHATAAGPNNASLIQIENLFKCCGYETMNSSAVPLDCQAVYHYTVPCKDQVTLALEGNLATIGGAAISIGVIEIVGLIFSMVNINVTLGYVPQDCG